jgi:hypothetical protein
MWERCEWRENEVEHLGKALGISLKYLVERARGAGRRHAHAAGAVE